nr:SdiA-regulated domain-containing protein [Saprospiraceae bacterium]
AGLRRVFAFDLKSKQLSANPVYTIDPDEVNRLVPLTDDDKHRRFSPSGIAIHPITGDVYITSTALKRLVVLDYQTGKIRFAVRLNKKLLPQPEGIAFDAKGNLHLSSEGKKGEGLVFKFDYKPPK